MLFLAEPKASAPRQSFTRQCIRDGGRCDRIVGRAWPKRVHESKRRSRPMKPAINIITLAVGDLERALRCDGLGLDSPGIKVEEFLGDERQAAGAVAMFEFWSIR
jgi:hypothetical protein